MRQSGLAHRRIAPPMNDQPLMIALVAVQFLVHALGWSMAAYLYRGWRAAEGQFAGFWLALGVGLLLYVPALPSGHALRNLGDVLIVAGVALQHRGLALYWGRPAADRAALAWLALCAAVILLSLGQPHGHAWRVVMVCVGVGGFMAATARLVWQQGRAATPAFALLLCAAYGTLALALFARALQALAADPAAKISIDAPGRGSLALVILVMFVGGLMNLAQIRLVLGRLLQRLIEQAQTDALTGTANRRGLLRCLEELHQRAQRGGHGYAVLMVDVDHFKAINDRHGHAEGDRVLQRVATGLREGLRVGDVIARWGGEEFCVLLPRIGADDAHALAERMTRRIAESGEPRVTVSVGVAEVQAALEGAEEVLRRADAALYRAKESGRNRVMVAADGLEPGASSAI
jgi:diguanylate cyclase (GGDEF)-like protein